MSKAAEYSKSHAHLVPSYLGLEQIGVDYENAQRLSTSMDKATRLQQMLSDTHMVHGSFAFDMARRFYNAVKQAMSNNVQGAKQIYEELGRRFAMPKRKKEEQKQEGQSA
jgi:hypothetical protein